MEHYNGAKPLKAISKVRAYEKALLEMRGRMDGRIKSLKTAWPKFNDATLNGLEWNTLTVVGARPGVGKTLFSEIKGDSDTIMGLPVKKIKEYLKSFS